MSKSTTVNENGFTNGGRRFYQLNKDDFRFKFYLHQAFKLHGHTKTWKQRKAVNLKSFSLITSNTRKAC